MCKVEVGLPEVHLGDIVGITGEERRAEAFIIQVPTTFITQVFIVFMSKILVRCHVLAMDKL